jgi:predicted RNA-binding protein (virulence factor B family)
MKNILKILIQLKPEENNMSTTIGESAGKLWAFLEANGAASPSKIEKEAGLAKAELQRAIGWLAKEDKILIEVNGRSEVLSLK